MVKQMSEEEIYEQAKKRVVAKKSFYSNLGSWAAVNIVLVIIWALTDSGGYLWFLWPLCIWGFFVLLNFIQVFVFPGRSDKAAIEKEVEKIKREQV
ncbi:2TM domain-containing protein [Chloroflexota bacterium]